MCIKKRIDIKKGKELFYEYYGDTFGIENDLGRVYEKCNVPKGIEKVWLDDIRENLITTLKSEDCVGQNLYKSIMRYTHIWDKTKLVESIGILQECLRRDIDSFRRLIICEHLKDSLRWIKDYPYEQQLLGKLISQQKAELLSHEITIDESAPYVKHLSKEELSTEAILKRINKL